MSRYVLTQKLHGRLGNLRCYRCNQLIEVGQEVESKSHGRRTKIKYYHVPCYEAMFMDL